MSPFSRALVAAAALTGVALLSGCQPQNTAAPATAGDTMLVTEVVDGDTFKVVDGRTIRVLGIDSCEAQTPGGQQATTQAAGLLRNKFVTLTAEPGVDVDMYGRQLRYVTMQDGGQDFGRTMIPAVHTGLYDGGDAAPQRIAELTALDVAPQRLCGDEPASTTTSAPPPPPTTEEQDVPDPDVDRPRTYVPVPDPGPRRDTSSDGSGSDSSGSGGGSGSDGATKPRSGQSGHPCRAGERDGDNDGYCGEGR